MQIERTPPLWPYLVALAMLLLLSLTAPWYWHPQQATTQRTKVASQTATNLVRHGTGSPVLGTSGIWVFLPDSVDPIAAAMQEREDDRPACWLSPLLSSSPPKVTWKSERLAFRLCPTLTQPQPVMPQPVSLNKHVDVAIRLAGGELAKVLSTPIDLPDVRLRRAPQPEPAQTGLVLNAPRLRSVLVRVDDSHDRLAMRPDRAEARRTPVITAPRTRGTDRPMTASPEGWTGPTALISQLKQLEQSSYAAEWASDVLVEINRLTKSPSLTSDGVDAVFRRLRRLSAAAQRLARSTDDELVRIELLRTRLALRRRIDLWPLMRDSAPATHRGPQAHLASNRSGGPATAQESPVDLWQLTQQLEAYESRPTPVAGEAIANGRLALALSPEPQRRQLAERIERYYRNANVRMEVAEDLLNRLVQQPDGGTYQPVRDVIAGTPVRGESWTNTKLHVRLVPDDQQARFQLVARGTVSSNTVSSGGPARVMSQGHTDFTARKLVLVTGDGVTWRPSTAQARSFNELTGIRTEYDGVPLFRNLVRSRAQQEFHSRRGIARAEVEMKVADQAQQRLDTEAGATLEKLDSQLRGRLDRLELLGLDAKLIELRSNDQTIVARMRVASDDQLAAHTPRNQAPADSLASLQLHQSALVNALARLDLDGQRLTAVELQDRLQEKLAHVPEEPTDDVPENTIFHFDRQQALDARIAGGRLELTLAMRELIHDGRPTRRFKVHAFYRPEVHGLKAQLVRDGVLAIEGRLRSTDRARLHAVFNKIFDENRPLDLVKLPDENLDRMKGLIVTQLILEDGWLGLAIGPQVEGRTAQLSRAIR